MIKVVEEEDGKLMPKREQGEGGKGFTGREEKKGGKRQEKPNGASLDIKIKFLEKLGT